MAYFLYRFDVLQRFCLDAFRGLGFTEAESEIITDVLLLSDLFGIESHGMQRLGRYHRAIAKGTIIPSAKPEIIHETPISAVLDGHDGMGQLIGHRAMTLAIEKAKKTGCGIVAARNSNHYGIAGYYAKMACEAGLIGISVTNSAGIMVPTYCRRAMLGSNPIAAAIPAEPFPFLFDASTTVVTRGKLEVYNKAGKPLPHGWALDAAGHETQDAADVLKNIDAKAGGGILPLGGSTEKMGGHKGYGYAMLCEFFSAIVSLGTTSERTYTDGKGGVCHGFFALDPNVFGDADAIKAYFSEYLATLRASDKAESQPRIYTHGEKEVEAAERIRREGVPVNDKTVDEMRVLCGDLHMDFDAYFGV